MKLLFMLLLPFVMGASATSHSTFKPAIASKVYICDSKSSVAYHNSRSCAGLNRCTHDIIEVTEKSAKDDYGMRKCKKCW